MKVIGKVWDDISDNIGVGAHIQRLGHPEVVGAVSFEELDEDTVSTVLSLQEARPRDPDTGEAHLDSQTVSGV